MKVGRTRSGHDAAVNLMVNYVMAKEDQELNGVKQTVFGPVRARDLQNNPPVSSGSSSAVSSETSFKSLSKSFLKQSSREE